MLTNTAYLDRDGNLQHRLDRGSDRRTLTHHVENDLPTGTRVLAVVIVAEPVSDELQGTVHAV